MPTDMALFFQLMELAGFQNTKFINTYYTVTCPIPDNNQSLYAQEQFEGKQMVRKKGVLTCFLIFEYAGFIMKTLCRKE